MVKNFHLVCYGNKSAFLAWDKAKNASYYLLYSYDAASGQYTRITKTSARNYQVKKLKDGQTYQFVIQSVNSRKGRTTKSAYSAPLTVVGRSVSLDGVHARRWAVRTKRAIQAKDLKTKKMVRIKKGAAGTTSSHIRGTLVVKFKKGVRVKISRKNLSFHNLTLSKSYKHYSKAKAEAFVNARGYTSRTKWLVWISQYTGSIHIFKGSQGNWQRMRIAKCVIGSNGHTVPGIFHMLRRSTTHGKPSIHFSWNPAKQWGLAFHCRIDSHTRGPYSNGCVRLGDADLTYLANHCPIGTTVVSY